MKLPTRSSEGGLPDYYFKPAPANYPTRADLTRLGVVPPLAERKPTRRAAELLPRDYDTENLKPLATIREVVEDFEKRNRLRLTGSGSNIRPLDWDEWRALERGLFELISDGSDLA